MASRVLLPLAAAAICVSGALLPIEQLEQLAPRDVPGVLSFPLTSVETPYNIVSKARRDVDTDVPILNVSSTSYLIQRKNSELPLLALALGQN